MRKFGSRTAAAALGWAAVDKRLKAVALLTLDATWADWFFNYFSFAPSDKPEYAQAMKQFDPVVLLPQIAPTPLFLQFSDRDQFVSAEVAQQLTDRSEEHTSELQSRQ